MLEPTHVSKCDLGMLRWVLAEPLWVAKASLSWGHRSALAGVKPCPRQTAWPRVVGSLWGVMLYRTSALASLAGSPRSWVRQAPPPCLPAWLLQNCLHSTWWQWSLLWWMLSGGLHIPLPLTSSSLLSQFALSSSLPNWSYHLLLIFSWIVLLRLSHPYPGPQVSCQELHPLGSPLPLFSGPPLGNNLLSGLSSSISWS